MNTENPFEAAANSTPGIFAAYDANQEAIFAHLTKARGGKGYEMTFSRGPSLRGHTAPSYPVADKKAARAAAAIIGATPWNF